MFTKVKIVFTVGSLSLCSMSALAQNQESDSWSLSSASSDDRTGVGFNKKKLDKLLNCSVTMIENQYGGSHSASKGLSYLDAIMDRVHKGTTDLRDLVKKCRKELWNLKKDSLFQKDYRTREMSRDEKTSYLDSMQANASKNTCVLKQVAEKAANGRMVCRRAGGLDFKVGLIAAFSTGWEQYTCTTPLGRRFHVFGPSAGLGLGLGAEVEVGPVADRTFTLPMDRTRMVFTTDSSSSYAIVAGTGEVHGEDGEKISDDFTTGLGVSSTSRCVTLMKKKRTSNFSESGLYEMLGVKVHNHN